MLVDHLLKTKKEFKNLRKLLIMSYGHFKNQARKTSSDEVLCILYC